MVEKNIMCQQLQKIYRRNVCRIQVFRANLEKFRQNILWISNRVPTHFQKLFSKLFQYLPNTKLKKFNTMPYPHLSKFLIMKLNFTYCIKLHKDNELLCLQHKCDNLQRSRLEESVAEDLLHQSKNDLMQLSCFALFTHKQELPKNLNETRHKGERTL